MMKNATTRVVPLLLIALAWPAMGCAVPLPAPQLTATAESQIPVENERSGSVVLSSSSGAPSSSALSLQPAADNGAPPSALAPLEDDELAGATPTVEEADEADADETPEPTVDVTPVETPTPEEPTPTPEPEVDVTLYASQIVDLLNQYRLEQGLDILQFDATLSQAAADHARYMADNGFFGHYPPDGSTPSGRVAAAGFTGAYQGEALSAGQKSPAVALSRLLGSQAHADILLSSRSTLVGVGHHYDPASFYKHYWVIVTANP